MDLELSSSLAAMIANFYEKGGKGGEGGHGAKKGHDSIDRQEAMHTEKVGLLAQEEEDDEQKTSRQLEMTQMTEPMLLDLEDGKTKNSKSGTTI
jgi:hypothetical protein